MANIYDAAVVRFRELQDRFNPEYVPNYSLAVAQAAKEHGHDPTVFAQEMARRSAIVRREQGRVRAWQDASSSAVDANLMAKMRSLATDQAVLAVWYHAPACDCAQCAAVLGT